MEKSDSLVVPVKPTNKAAQAAADLVEGRSGTKGNAELQSTVRTQSRAAVSQAQRRIREAVNRNKKEKLTALLHHVTVDFLRAAFLSLKKRATAGIDAVTWAQYGKDLDSKLLGLHRRLHSGAYRALPTRRTYIPKANGKQRPLGIAAMEDKIVQAAVVMLLTPIYEAEFLGFSYGFRPGRSQHDALDALAYGIKGRYIWWILDADIRSFFDSISHEWLIRFLEHRIGDRRIIRLIQNRHFACYPQLSIFGILFRGISTQPPNVSGCVNTCASLGADGRRRLDQVEVLPAVTCNRFRQARFSLESKAHSVLHFNRKGPIQDLPREVDGLLSVSIVHKIFQPTHVGVIGSDANALSGRP